MAVFVPDPYGYYAEGGFYADTVHQQDLPDKSRLLGPDGNPLKLQPHPVGFNLSRKPGSA